MTVADPSIGTAISVIDRPIELAEVFPPDQLVELCTAHAELYDVGIKIYDRHHRPLVEIERAADLLDWLFQFAVPARDLTAFATALKGASPEQTEARSAPPLGLRYLVIPLEYAFERLGKLVCGPYLDRTTEPEAVAAAHPELEPTVLGSLLVNLARVSDAALERRMRPLLVAIEVVCHSGYERVLTSNMHVESIASAFEDLQVKHRELEAVNAQLRASNERLRDLDELKSNFLATVSHELRTPLTSIIGYSEMMLEGMAGELTGEQRGYVSTIMERGESLLHLIGGVLDIARIERGGHGLDLAAVDPRELIADALDNVRPQAHKGAVRLSEHISPDVGLVLLDPYKVRQVLINLLGNAVKFTKAGGEVRVRAALLRGEGHPRLWIEVQDDGIGIPPQHLERIFDPFYQVDNSSTREYGGTGLGLSIARSFIEAHGGELTASSQYGHGATFHLTLPVQVPENAHA